MREESEELKKVAQLEERLAALQEIAAAKEFYRQAYHMDSANDEAQPRASVQIGDDQCIAANNQHFVYANLLSLASSSNHSHHTMALHTPIRLGTDPLECRSLTRYGPYITTRRTTCALHQAITTYRSSTPFGIVFLSRKLLWNAVKCIREQGKDGIVASADGTYKLHFGGWYLSKKYQYRFLPWEYAFVRSESMQANRQLFSSLRAAIKSFFHEKLKVRVGILNNSSAIHGAFLAKWPKVELLTCWVHMLRTANKNCGQKEFSRIWSFLTYGHSISRKQSSNLMPSGRLFASIGLIKACTILHRRLWAKTSIQSGKLVLRGIGGAAMPNKNCIEAYHRGYKTATVATLQSLTAHVLNVKFPAILRYAGQLEVMNYGSFTPGPITTDMLLDGRLLEPQIQRPNLVCQSRCENRWSG
ncbi:TPA: LOW QUALITY PROTEIN: hypothetical protein N0F65_010865 [Lagenidium giganteum]|uniref:MULE transposase domain-containing protein n=1 Tax=Lagenidium giganteum TaxID=4803 RepID=A0AAV2Z1N4_9STRA|nr:TPA: LOW QUALITY PROTEIN: hypothetical protein N0F65_010865 [Lagenidium giganteum]